MYVVNDDGFDYTETTVRIYRTDRDLVAQRQRELAAENRRTVAFSEVLHQLIRLGMERR